MDPQRRALILGFMNALLSFLSSALSIVATVSTQHFARQRQLLREILSTNRPTVQNWVMADVTKDGNRIPKRRLWVRPGRTDAWWQNFLLNIVLPEEWLARKFLNV